MLLLQCIPDPIPLHILDLRICGFVPYHISQNVVSQSLIRETGTPSFKFLYFVKASQLVYSWLPLNSMLLIYIYIYTFTLRFFSLKIDKQSFAAGFTFKAAGNCKQKHRWWCYCCTCRKRQGGNGDGYSKA